MLLVGRGFATGQAQATPLVRDVALGQPPTPTRIAITMGGQAAAAQLDAGGTRVALPLHAPHGLDVQSVALKDGGVVAIARVSGADAERASALLVRSPRGRIEVPWVGVSDLRGDPGEREADIIQADDSDGDGRFELTVGHVAERIRLCGPPRTLLGARHFDPARMRFEPAESVQLGPPPEALLTAELDAAPTASAQPTALRVASAFDARGGADPDMGSADVLSDGELTKAWPASSGAFATFTWASANRALSEIVIVTAQPTAPARAGARPHEVWLFADDGTRARLEVPPAKSPRARVSVRLPKPIAAHCFSLIIDPRGEPRAALGVSEVQAYVTAQLAAEAGSDSLAAQLAGDDADAVVQALIDDGAQSLGLLLEQWSTLSNLARTRALHVATRLVVGDARALDVLALGLLDDSQSAHAVQALLGAGAAGRARLSAAIAAAPPDADRAALALARRAPTEALGPLLAALASEGGSERPLLREAIARAARAGGPAARTAITDFAASKPDALRARAALTLALTQAGPELHPAAIALLEADCERVHDFAERYRLARAARALPASPKADRWLVALSADAEHWMLRAAALEALHARQPSESATLGLSRLEDSNPRVRAIASGLLGQEPAALPKLALHATRDRWPLVRIACLETLGTRPDGSAALLAAVADRDHSVRAAALRGLTQAQLRSGWQVVAERMRDRGERPDVLAEAIAFAETLCIQEAKPLLLEWLELGRAPTATSEQTDAALSSLHALRRLGGDAERQALARASAASSIPALRSAAGLHAQTHACPLP